MSDINICHVVKVHFDRRSPKATAYWLDERYKFFQAWTLKSLAAQRVPHYLWLHCDPGMESMVDMLREVAPRESTVFTFNPYGRSCVDETRSDIGLGKALARCDYVYVTRIDSDDLYASTALGHVDKLRPAETGRVEAGIFRTGYAHDVRDSRLGVYSNPSSPFHTLMFPREVFLSPEKYAASFVGDHSMVNARYHIQSLPDWQFTVLIHPSNFLSTFDYSRQRSVPVERGWTPKRFVSQPIVFDVDDFCDEWDCTEELVSLKERYPNFRATLFAIPSKCSAELLRRAKQHPWLELAVHGITHAPRELLRTSRDQLSRFLRSLDYSLWTEGFRPPFWETSDDIVGACNDVGLWVALHDRDRNTFGPACTSGYYTCGARLPFSHHHSHDTCGNWLKSDLPTLLERWPADQQFSFVSDSVLVPQVDR